MPRSNDRRRTAGSNCSAYGNGGINVSIHGTVSSCSAESNGAGISTASGCKVTNCSAFQRQQRHQRHVRLHGRPGK
jgi:hypothetical protein